MRIASDAYSLLAEAGGWKHMSSKRNILPKVFSAFVIRPYLAARISPPFGVGLKKKHSSMVELQPLPQQRK